MPGTRASARRASTVMMQPGTGRREPQHQAVSARTGWPRLRCFASAASRSSLDGGRSTVSRGSATGLLLALGELLLRRRLLRLLLGLFLGVLGFAHGIEWCSGWLVEGKGSDEIRRQVRPAGTVCFCVIFFCTDFGDLAPAVWIIPRGWYQRRAGAVSQAGVFIPKNGRPREPIAQYAGGGRRRYRIYGLADRTRTAAVNKRSLFGANPVL